MLRVLDLFSGIGGFSLGLERTGGFETVAFCEIEDFPRRVLAKHWPNVPIHRDVRKLTGGDVGPVDVICGGYPCQPFSTAGKRRGKEDDRHLWPEFSRLVAELRPSWVIGENVAGHVSMGLDDVLSDLEGQGYACRTFVVPACAVNLPHRRDRCWTVAHAPNVQRNGKQYHAASGLGQVSEPRTRGGADDVADAERDHAQGQQPGITHAQERAQSGERPAGSCRDGDGWRRAEPRMGREFDGLSRWLDGGLINGTESKKLAAEILRDMWCDDDAEAIFGPLGRLGGVSKAEALLAFLCEYAEREDTGRLAMGRAEARRECLRSMWRHIELARSPLRPRHHEQHAREFADALRKLSRGAPSLYPAAGATGLWEIDLERVKAGVPDRAARLKALGNAVVPAIPEMIGRAILAAEMEAA